MRSSISEVRGFNYSGSWGTSGLDLWQHHDNSAMAVEIARGKAYFPEWNVARWWLSHEAFQRDRRRFLANFEAGLAIFAEHGIRTIPVLFNRWRDPICDFGGVPIDHILLGFAEDGGSMAGSESQWGPRKVFGDYLKEVVGAHADDQRVLAWDLCNEPLTVTDPENFVRQAELRWLSWCRDTGKAAGAVQPLTITCQPDYTHVELTEPLVDIISIQAYYVPTDLLDGSDLAHVTSKEGFASYLDDMVELAAKSGKELLGTETAWGAVDDNDRVEIMRFTLGELVRRNVGFIAHALHHSLVADLHTAEYGPIGFPGRLEFINADGSLRPGHDAFNEFA